MASRMLAPADEVRCELEDLPVERLIGIARSLLSEGVVRTPIVVDAEGRAVSNRELCVALKKLGVRYLPVATGGGSAGEVSVTLEELGFFDDVAPSPLRVFRSTEELLVRNWPTPLVLLRSASGPSRRVWAKLEGYNPFSMSVKDRIGWYMFRRALERCGRVPELLVEATSTNTGLAVAAMCALHGSRLRAYIPSTVSRTGELLLRVFGAEVVRSEKALTVEMLDDVDREGRRLGAVHLNQFYNDANFEVHLRYTAKELDLQLREAGARPRAIVGGLGTSGHVSAIATYFKSRYGDVRVYGVVPKPGTSIQGIRRVETGMRWVHLVEIDGVVEVGPDEAAQSVLELARREGILVGLSSGAVYAAYKQLSGGLGDGDVVLVFPDHGFKYVEQLSRHL